MAGDAEVKLKFVSDEKALASMEQRLAAVTAKLDAMAAAGKKAGQTKVTPEKLPTLQAADPTVWQNATSGITGYLTQAFAVAKVIDLIGAGVHVITDANSKWQNQLSGMDKRLEVMQARVIMQAGGTDKTARDVVRTAAEGAMDVPALGENLEDYVNAQVYLEGSSFKKEDVKSGKTLKAMNEVMAGVSAFEGGQEFSSSKDAMAVMSTMINAWGKEGNVEDIEHLGTVARGAFKSTTMQGGDLRAFAKTAPVFAQMDVSEEESLSRFAATKEATGSAEETATAMKNYLLNLSDLTPERQRLLDELGVNASDVSVEKGGTKLGESIATMKAALSGKDEEDKNRITAALFGKESSAGISAMMAQEGRAQSVQAEMTDREEFKEAAASFGGTELADRRRRGLRLQKAEAETVWKQGGVTFDQLAEERAADTAEKRLGARGPLDQIGITIDNKVQETVDAINQGIGLGPTDNGITKGQVESGIGATLSTLGPSGQIVEYLRKIATNTEVDRARNRFGNVEPVQSP